MASTAVRDSSHGRPNRRCDQTSNDRFGSFSTEAANTPARPTSASLQKLTSDANEKLVAMGKKQTCAR
jgi:hypothetical protein